MLIKNQIDNNKITNLMSPKQIVMSPDTVVFYLISEKKCTFI